MLKTLQISKTYVVDGDTIKVKTNEGDLTVRLYGIDAPEIGQPLGEESAKTLRSMMEGEENEMWPVEDDKYGRSIGIVFPANQPRNSYNAQLIRNGMAYWYQQYGGKEIGFDEIEAKARKERIGVWKESKKGGQRPWKYRKHQNRWEGLGAKIIIWFASISMLGIIAAILAKAVSDLE